MAKVTHRKVPVKTGQPVAIVGGESLLGKEIREVVESAEFPASLRLIATSDDGVIITERDGEPIIMSPLQVEELASAKIVVLAGSAESSRKAYGMMEGRKGAPVFIDAQGALEDNPESRLRAPMAETGRPASGRIQVVAHPAAIVLAITLKRLNECGPVRRCVATVFEPASEQGQRGLDELQQQTVGLLSFQKLKKEVYDAQVSFNLLPSLGEDAPQSLEDVELGIDRHLASLLSTGGNLPMPSLRVVQAPVFHGHSFSLWVEFEKNPGVKAIEKGLAGPYVDVRMKDHEPPSNVAVAGHSGITVGGVRVDRNEARACWLWMAADNLRISADNVLEVAREFLA